MSHKAIKTHQTGEEALLCGEGALGQAGPWGVGGIELALPQTSFSLLGKVTEPNLFL